MRNFDNCKWVLNPNVRHDFVIVVDVANGNPNGDPDNDNAPRIDFQTSHGRISHESMKRRARNYFTLVRSNEKPYRIFMQERAVLNTLIKQATDATKTEAPKKGFDSTRSAQKYMCDNYVDIRLFGGVLSTGKGDHAGSVTGPFQIVDAVSVEPIYPLQTTITRCAVTNEKDEHKERTMGRRYTIPYACYLAKGYYSPADGSITGVTEEDMQLFWNAVLHMYEYDRSAARGSMDARKLVIFSHDSALGNDKANKLFERVTLLQKDPSVVTRDFADYRFQVDQDNLNDGVQVVVLD